MLLANKNGARSFGLQHKQSLARLLCLILLVLAVLLVLALSFLLGRILTSQIGSRCSQWFEHTILFRVPGYFAVKSILHGLTDTEREGMVRPALFICLRARGMLFEEVPP